MLFSLYTHRFWGEIQGFILFPRVLLSTHSTHFWKVSGIMSIKCIFSQANPFIIEINFSMSSLHFQGLVEYILAMHLVTATLAPTPTVGIKEVGKFYLCMQHCQVGVELIL